MFFASNALGWGAAAIAAIIGLTLLICAILSIRRFYRDRRNILAAQKIADPILEEGREPTDEEREQLRELLENVAIGSFRQVLGPIKAPQVVRRYVQWLK